MTAYWVMAIRYKSLNPLGMKLGSFKDRRKAILPNLGGRLPEMGADGTGKQRLGGGTLPRVSLPVTQPEPPFRLSPNWSNDQAMRLAGAREP